MLRVPQYTLSFEIIKTKKHRKPKATSVYICDVKAFEARHVTVIETQFEKKSHTLSIVTHCVKGLQPHSTELAVDEYYTHTISYVKFPIE